MTRKFSLPPETVAKTGANRLAALVNNNGRFQYLYDSATGERLKGYNVLRHCGAIWSMAEAAPEFDNPSGLAATCRRSLGYLFRNHLRYFNEIDVQCIVSNSAVKLGGNGLAILAILAYEKLARDESLLMVARNLGRYILGQTRSDNDFEHKRSFPKGELADFRSDYYTGEALFALARLHGATGEAVWLEVAMRSELALARRDYGVKEQSHWCLYAAEALHGFDPNPAVYEQGKRIVEHIIEFPAYRERNQSTPTACRTEGMLAFLRMARRADIAADRALRERCLAEVEENLQLQLRFRKRDGGFVQGADSSHVRIDYIQHSLSGFLEYDRLMRGGGI